MFSPLLLVSGSGLAVLAVEATKSSRRKRLRKRLQVAHHGAAGVSVKAPRGSNGFGARLCAALVPRQLDLATEDSDIASIEQWAGRYFVVSSIALPFAVLGNWIPVLALPSIAILALSTLPILKRSYAGLVHQKRVKMEVVSALVLPLMIVSGYLPAAAFGYWTYFLGMLLLARAKRRSTEAVAGLIADTLQSVWIEQDGQEIEIRFCDLRLNDLVVVQGGGKIPVDGVVVKGLASVDQRMLTGEAQPADKEIGDQVFALTTVIAGKVWIRAEQTGRQTVALQIQQVLEQTNDFGALVESRIERAADCFALPTLALGALALPVAGYTSALVVLDSAIIDHLFITGNLGVLTHLAAASRNGMLIKDARALERLTEVDTVVFDKTGTLTEEQPHVGQIHQTDERFTESTVLYYAAIAEHKQNHPIAAAIARASLERGLVLPTVDDAHYEIGYGVRVQVQGQTIQVGSQRFMASEDIPVTDDMLSLQASAHAKGYSFVYVAVGGTVAGIIELHPTLRPEAADIIQKLERRGLSTCILSGDQEAPTRALAAELGIEQYFADTLPTEKASRIRDLQAEGKTVCFVGDGINDAIALKQADVAVSLSGASSFARDAAQVVLLDGTLVRLDALFQRAAGLKKTVGNSILWDVVPNTACIIGAYFFHLGIYGALMIYTIGLAGGVANGMLPLLRRRERKDVTRGEASDAADGH